MFAHAQTGGVCEDYVTW